jgi:hypothetical protein
MVAWLLLRDGRADDWAAVVAEPHFTPSEILVAL